MQRRESVFDYTTTPRSITCSPLCSISSYLYFCHTFSRSFSSSYPIPHRAFRSYIAGHSLHVSIPYQTFFLFKWCMMFYLAPIRLIRLFVCYMAQPGDVTCASEIVPLQNFQIVFIMLADLPCFASVSPNTIHY